jgi:hypothetical protein
MTDLIPWIISVLNITMHLLLGNKNRLGYICGMINVFLKQNDHIRTAPAQYGRKFEEN